MNFKYFSVVLLSVGLLAGVIYFSLYQKDLVIDIKNSKEESVSESSRSLTFVELDTPFRISSDSHVAFENYRIDLVVKKYPLERNQQGIELYPYTSYKLTLTDMKGLEKTQELFYTKNLQSNSFGTFFLDNRPYDVLIDTVEEQSDEFILRIKSIPLN